ncbi:hypothetical protein KIW84_UN0393 [Lathyrus oleraceus]|nr:hypothetical protein KIW84_UN0393 [Pisum sativum]
MASTQKAISRHQGENFVEELLDGSVKILDVCGITRDTMLDIKKMLKPFTVLLEEEREIQASNQRGYTNEHVYLSIHFVFLGSQVKGNQMVKMAKLMHRRTSSCEEENLNELQCVDASLRTLLREGSDVVKMQVAHECFEALESATEGLEKGLEVYLGVWLKLEFVF